MGARNCRIDLDWLMAKVKVGSVGIGTDWRYYLTLKPGEPPILCDDEVYALADADWVVLEPDGPVTASREWRRRYDALSRQRAAERVKARRPTVVGGAAA